MQGNLTACSPLVFVRKKLRTNTSSVTAAVACGVIRKSTITAMKYELSKLYESKGIDYNCAEEKENLTLIALFYLTNEQGGEGQL